MFATTAAEALGCDVAFVALPMLAAISGAIGNTRVILLKGGWEEPAVVWAAPIGDSGTLKSPAMEKARFAPLFAIQRTRSSPKFKQQMQAHKAANKDKKDDGEPKPIRERITCSDTTIEKLAELLEDNQRGLLLERDELNGWLLSFSRYRSSGSDLPQWLSMFRAGPITYDRKTGERSSVHVPRAAVSVTGGIQPGVLVKAFSADFLDAGGGARIVMAMPPKSIKKWSNMEVDPDTASEYAGLFKLLLGLKF